MSGKLYLRVLSVVLVGLFLFSACDNSTSESFEESVEIFSDLEIVEGASNVTAVINKGSKVAERNKNAVGSNSFFQIQLEGIGSNEIINNGIVGGWCLEWKKDMRSNNDVHVSNRIYSTKGSDKWKPINYLFAIKKDLERNNPTLTVNDFQAIIWSLAGYMGIGPEFDVMKLSNKQLPDRLLENGQPNFSKDKVVAITKRVKNEYSAAKLKSTSELGGVVMQTQDEDEQDVFIPDPPPVIEVDTNIYIYFDSSGSMNSTLDPLNTVRNDLLKSALLPLYDDDETAYNNRVNVISNSSENTFQMLNLFGNTPADGNIVVLVFQDESHTDYHSSSSVWDANTPRTSIFDSDMSTLRSRLDSFESDPSKGSAYYRGVIFQVQGSSIYGAENFKELIQAVENGTGNYGPPNGLSDRDEFNYVYDVIDGDTPQTYRDLIIQALRDLGFSIPTPTT